MSRFISCSILSIVAVAAAIAVLLGSGPRAWAAPGNPLAAYDTRPPNGSCVAGDSPGTSGVRLQRVWPEISNLVPFDIRPTPGTTDQFHVISRAGLMYRFVPGAWNQQVLDIRARIGVNSQDNAYELPGSEHWGLVSFAFHPDFTQNGWVFVLYNGRQANEAYTTSYVSRFTMKPDGTGFDPASELVIISTAQPDGYLHHYGQLAFGPDGYLYISSGDGTLNGPTYFPNIPSQRLNDLRGKILRLDVDNSSEQARYAIPADNPWRDVAGARPEMYAIGVRNPWRFSFDSYSGELWLGDVGQAEYEEVSVVTRGANLGWSVFEGKKCRNDYPGPGNCTNIATVPPVADFYHNGLYMAVVGGFVYRGSELPELQGKYVFQLYGPGQMLAISRNGDQVTVERLLDNLTPGIATFFTDHQNELYGIDVWGGGINKIVKGDGVGDAAIPQLLSQTGCVQAANPKAAVRGAIPFEVKSQLWSDGANKKRWSAIPNGKSVDILPDGDFSFPVGSVLMKTFLFNGKMFETRLLKHHNDGSWAGYTYEWRADGTDAVLVPAEGKTIQVRNNVGTLIDWHLPGRGECMICHTQAANIALGPEVAQLNSLMRYPAINKTGHQLITWAHIGRFSGPLPAPVADLPALTNPLVTVGTTVTQRARSYLHSNCSGCHRPGNDLRATIDFRYQPDINAMNICNADPRIDDLGIPGAKLLTPRKPDLSIIPARMGVRGANQMPPLGTGLVHSQGNTLIRNWIRRPDVCTTLPDTDGDGIPDAFDNCAQVSNRSQWDSDGDGYGNRCDGDLDNNLVVDDTDRGLLQAALGSEFGQPAYHDAYDLNVDGWINDLDLALYNGLAGGAPGPSGFRP